MIRLRSRVEIRRFQRNEWVCLLLGSRYGGYGAVIVEVLGLAPKPKSIQRHPLDQDPVPSDIDWIYGSARVDENVDPPVTLISNICRYQGFICAERGK